MIVVDFNDTIEESGILDTDVDTHTHSPVDELSFAEEGTLAYKRRWTTAIGTDLRVFDAADTPQTSTEIDGQTLFIADKSASGDTQISVQKRMNFRISHKEAVAKTPESTPLSIADVIPNDTAENKMRTSIEEQAAAQKQPEFRSYPEGDPDPELDELERELDESEKNLNIAEKLLDDAQTKLVQMTQDYRKHIESLNKSLASLYTEYKLKVAQVKPKIKAHNDLLDDFFDHKELGRRVVNKELKMSQSEQSKFVATYKKMLKQLNDLYKDVTERTTEIKQLERRIDLAQGDRERHEHYIEDKELEFLKFNQEVLQPAADRFDEAKKAYQDALARYQALTRSRSEALIRNHEVN